MKKNKKTILLMLVMLLALLGASLLVKRSQETRRGAFYGGVSMMLLPSERTVLEGDEFKVKLNVNPISGENVFLINGVNLTLNFDKSIVELVGVEYDDIFTGSKKVEEANESGKFNLVVVTTVDREELHQDVFDLATLTFKAKASGNTSINKVGDYEIGGSRGQEGNIDRTLQLKSFSKSDISVVHVDPNEPSEWPILYFKVVFGGTNYKIGDEQVAVDNIPDQEVKVIVKKGNLEKEFDGVVVSFNEQAIGEGKVVLAGVPEGKNYSILIKGPVHLARKFCQQGQKEHCWAGQEKIDLVKGDNVYDWTGLDLEPGDINADGKVDATDFSMLKTALSGTGKEDINFNGVVNSQDIVIFLKTLSTKYEEEI